MGDVGEIADYAREMDDFLDKSELTERRAFIESFVKEVVVMPGAALLRFTMPMPHYDGASGSKTEDIVLNDMVLSKPDSTAVHRTS